MRLEDYAPIENLEKIFDYLSKDVAPHEASLQSAVSQYVEVFTRAVSHLSLIDREFLRDAAEQTLLLTSTDFLPLQHHYREAWESLNALRPIANRYLHHGLN